MQQRKDESPDNEFAKEQMKCLKQKQLAVEYQIHPLTHVYMSKVFIKLQIHKLPTSKH